MVGNRLGVRTTIHLQVLKGSNLCHFGEYLSIQELNTCYNLAKRKRPPELLPAAFKVVAPTVDKLRNPRFNANDTNAQLITAQIVDDTRLK